MTVFISDCCLTTSVIQNTQDPASWYGFNNCEQDNLKQLTIIPAALAVLVDTAGHNFSKYVFSDANFIPRRKETV